MKFLIVSVLLTLTSTCQQKKLPMTVMMGDSITSEWFRLRPEFFEGKQYINKGISGQTSAEMVARFHTDVIALRPKKVVILAGTNDIAQNQGPVPISTVFENIRTMAESARANGIEVILCSVLPSYDYPWRPGLEPNKKIPELNGMIEEYAKKNNISYIDYFSAMKDERNGLRKELGRDGVHPVVAGYKVMERILEAVISRTTK